jgi:hypothetical protein
MAFTFKLGAPAKRLQLAGYKCVPIAYTKASGDKNTGNINVTGLNKVISVDLSDASGSADVVGEGSIASSAVTTGGSSYTTATISFTDPTGRGSGAAGVVTVSSGAVSSIAITRGGSHYSSNTTATITGDGSGATASVTLNTSVVTQNVIAVGNMGGETLGIIYARGESK